MVKVICVHDETAVVLNTIHESAGMVASLKEVRFEPVVVFVMAVAEAKISVDPPPPALLVLWYGSIVHEVPAITAWHSVTVMATKVKPIEISSEALGFSTVILY